MATTTDTNLGDYSDFSSPSTGSIEVYATYLVGYVSLRHAISTGIVVLKVYPTSILKYAQDEGKPVAVVMTEHHDLSKSS